MNPLQYVLMYIHAQLPLAWRRAPLSSPPQWSVSSPPDPVHQESVHVWMERGSEYSAAWKDTSMSVALFPGPCPVFVVSPSLCGMYNVHPHWSCSCTWERKRGGYGWRTWAAVTRMIAYCHGPFLTGQLQARQRVNPWSNLLRYTATHSLNIKAVHWYKKEQTAWNHLMS